VTPLRSPFADGFGPGAADALASTLKALASPARLRILALLAAGHTLTGTEIEHALKDLAQPTLAHHLSVLDAAGLITTQRKGVYAYRSLDPDRVRAIAALLQPAGARRRPHAGTVTS
jgi:ArsR family transcriptional regulator